MAAAPRADSDQSTPSVDPLTLFLDVHRRGLAASRRGRRFNAGEHAWLASHGAEAACKRLKDELDIEVETSLFEEIARRSGREKLQYGELVALSGDFYESADALFDEKPSPFPWLWQANDLSDLRRIFDKELQWIESRRQGHGDRSYPDENIRLAWNAKSYVELALRNTDHFGWHNLVAYCRNHAAALRLAASTGGRDDETFRRALYTNAFADHFLTDCFAAGHIRIPRAEIRAWADRNGLDEKVAGALSKLLHDQDGHVDLGSLHGDVDENRPRSHDGLRVQNAAGAEWHTYCDGQLFLDADAGHAKAIQHAVDAVSASVFELLLAWKRREMPDGVYSATSLAPFPHPEAPALTRKFPADISDADLEKLWQSIAWYVRVPWLAGLERGHVRELFKALPGIMVEFRASIAAAAADAEVSLRIDPRYIAAYNRVA